MKQNRILYRIIIIVAFLGINALLIFGISQVLAYLNTGADSSTIFHPDLLPENYYTPILTWDAIDNPGRPMEQPTLQRIENDYLRSWHTRYEAYRTGDSVLVKDLFTDKAREKIHGHLQYNLEHGIHIEGTTLEHHLTVDFYSADGKLVVLSDRNVHQVERMFENNVFQYEHEERSDYRVIMLLEDGYWRTRHFEKLRVISPEITTPIPVSFNNTIKGINYYPQQAAWDTFGEQFSVDTLQSDFNMISKLKFNTLRVFVGFEDFGKATVTDEKLKKLNLLLDEAAASNLKVVVTLFDFYGDYRVSDWSMTIRHAHAVVNAIKHHPALLSWDIKNEPDLDYESRGELLVRAWLKQMMQAIQEWDPAHPVTIGWSNVENALTLKEAVDYISFHYYEDLDQLSTKLTDLRKATSKPIVLEEFGYSSYSGIWNFFLASEEGQASYYKEFLETQKRDSIHYLSWTLYDFAEIPSEVAGNYPWRKNKQTRFGLISTEGQPKKAFRVLQDH